MQRIQSSGSVAQMPAIETSDIDPGFFQPGNPATGQQATVVTADWLNSVQEEILHVIEAAGLTPDPKNLSQLKMAIQKSVRVEIYEMCEVYHFLNPVPRSGFVQAAGGLIHNADEQYPLAWKYLQSEEGQSLCVSEEEWQALSTATYYGSEGWNGIGGVTKYVIDTGAKTIRVPDLRGMYAESSGLDGLSVGGVHNDMVRDASGKVELTGCYVASNASGVFKAETQSARYATGNSSTNYTAFNFQLSRVVPTGNYARPRAFGVYTAVFLGGKS